MSSVPAWTVQSGSYSYPDYVFVLTDDIDDMGWPRTRLVHRLTPVDQHEQHRLQQIVPERIKEKMIYCVIDSEGATLDRFFTLSEARAFVERESAGSNDLAILCYRDGERVGEPILRACRRT